jgi:hypothetical protein
MAAVTTARQTGLVRVLLHVLKQLLLETPV